MSIDTLARKLAKKGRNGDDVLVHMSRHEVAGLQELARSQGKSLTINPETGLPEAFSLKSILPTLAGAAAGFMTMNPYIGAGVSALATKGMGGSDKAALMSGLGSYFGAGSMGANLGGAAAEGVGEAALQEGAVQGLGEAAVPLDALAPQAAMPGPEWAGSYTDLGGQQVAGEAAGAATAGPGVEQLTAENQGLALGEAQPGYTPAERWNAMPAQEQMSRAGDVSFDQWKDKMGGWSGVGQSGIAALGTANALETIDNKFTPQKLKMGIQEYRFDPKMQRNVPVDSREYQHFGNEFTKGAYRDVSAAEGGIMRLAAGGPTNPASVGSASTTGGYKPEQAYGVGQTGGYDPRTVYGAQATMPQATQGAQIPSTPGTVAQQTAPGTQKFLFDPKTGGFSVNPAWQSAQDATAAAATAQQAAAQSNFQQDWGSSPSDGGGYAQGGIASLGDYSDGGRLLRGPGDGVSDSIPAHIDGKRPARLANNEFVIPARIVSELGNGSTDAGSKRLYDMMDRIQKRRAKTVGKDKVAVDSKAYKELPA